MHYRFWPPLLSLAFSRRLYAYGVAVPAAIMLIAIATLFMLHQDMGYYWRIGSIAVSSFIMLFCVCWAMLRGHRYDLRLSPAWALMGIAVLGWVYVDYVRNILFTDGRLYERAHVRSIDVCARHLHISHPACQQLLEIRPGHVLDTGDVLYELKVMDELKQS